MVRQLWADMKDDGEARCKSQDSIKIRDISISPRLVWFKQTFRPSNLNKSSWDTLILEPRLLFVSECVNGSSKSRQKPTPLLGPRRGVAWVGKRKLYAVACFP